MPGGELYVNADEYVTDPYNVVIIRSNEIPVYVPAFVVNVICVSESTKYRSRATEFFC